MVNDIHDIEVPHPFEILDQGDTMDDRLREDKFGFIQVSANMVES